MNCIKQELILPIIPLYLTCLPQKNRKFFVDNFDRFSDSYTAYLNSTELDEILDEIPDSTVYPINENLIEVIGIKHRRK